jgi:hypothetical protein
MLIGLFLMYVLIGLIVLGIGAGTRRDDSEIFAAALFWPIALPLIGLKGLWHLARQ